VPPRITIDTNIYISALNFGGTPMDVLHSVIDGNATLATSEPIIAEVLRVLRDKFEWNPAGLAEAEQTIRSFSTVVQPSQVLYIIEADPSDNRILECAVESQSDLIVSGDSHLLRLGAYSTIKIVTARQFLLRATGPAGLAQ
jgi:uncharacterized protein